MRIGSRRCRLSDFGVEKLTQEFDTRTLLVLCLLVKSNRKRLIMKSLINIYASPSYGTKVALTTESVGERTCNDLGADADIAKFDGPSVDGVVECSTPTLLRSAGGEQVLRISIERDPGALSLILEGRLVGPWVDEMRRISALHITRNVPLTVDLEGLTAMDARGQVLLEELRQDGARLRCSDVMNQYLVEQMARPPGKAQEACRPCRRFTSQSDSSAAAEDAFRSSQAS